MNSYSDEMTIQLKSGERSRSKEHIGTGRILNIFGHQGNTNQNHNKLYFKTTVRTVKTEHEKQGSDVEKPELCTLLLGM